MPWKETGVTSERIRFVVEALKGDESMSAVCRRFGISRKTGYKWLARSRQAASLSDLGEVSRRPKRSPLQSSPKIEERVLELRASHGWGSRKLQALLAREDLTVGRCTIDRILDRHGVMRERSGSRPAVTRFERERPNELLQMDFKGQFQLASGAWCYPLSLLDDHSRFALALSGLPSLHGAGVEPVLRASFERHGVPESMLMDHGAPWWSGTNGHGLTELGVFLIRQGVTLVYSGVGHPQTQGKVERFHRTLAAWVRHHRPARTLEGFQDAFVAFQEEYNSVRPHEALGLQTPAQRYRHSLKTYQAQPPDWQYPPNSEVLPVASNGCVYLAGGYRFICEALRGQTVRLERFANRALVSYRHMLIRELDLTTGASHAVIRPHGSSGH
jgi:transposase InsO family protein